MRRHPAWVPGRDRRAQRHPAAPGARDDGRRHHVAVLGGGIAGLAAATALAERDVTVTVLEREEQLGGRVRSWPVDLPSGPVTMSRGFHAFFRQYYNLRSLLRRADPALGRLTPVRDYPLVSAEGYRDSFARTPRTPPFNLVGFVLASKTFRMRDMTRIDGRAAVEMLRVDFPRTFAEHDDESAADYLRRLRFPAAARHLALEVFARSFFADPEEFSSAELLAMFHAYFLGSAEGLLFDVPSDDYDTALWAPLSGYLAQRGVETRTGTTVQAVRSARDGVIVTTNGAELRADAVVVATDVAATQALLSELGDASWQHDLRAQRSAPPFAVWRGWLDRSARPDRPPFLGTAGFGRVDNISVLERFESGAHAWHREHGGSVVEVHAYALGDAVDQRELTAEMRDTLGRLYPELEAARTVHEEFLLRADCPLIGVGGWASRPGVATPDPRIALAGDGVRCDYPVALMERAATTGFQAANHLLAGWGVKGQDLWTVPTAPRYPTSPARTRYRRSA